MCNINSEQDICPEILNITKKVVQILNFFSFPSFNILAYALCLLPALFDFFFYSFFFFQFSNNVLQINLVYIENQISFSSFVAKKQ